MKTWSDVATEPETPPTTVSQAQLTKELGALRLNSPLMVHASLRRLGWVIGGPSAAAHALQQALSPSGTLIVPAFTPENSATSRDFLHAVSGMSEAEAADYKASMPPFDPATTPAVGMGVLAETVRGLPGAMRSDHPQTSFAAVGPAAEAIVSGHRRDRHFGEDSPLGRLYAMDAQVLLIGVDFSVLTAFHLAEYRIPNPPLRSYECVVRGPQGEPEWWSYEDVALDDSDFGAMGRDFEREGHVLWSGRIGSAHCRLLRVRDAADFAVEWLPSHRDHVTPADRD